ncbi:sigma-54-dependent Fis family transcriptional regulator [candidate division KSB1 bacterium]|nr:sigma-54-dependent Fis family transcriptional regulator [candidate division KSB1 bacterium]RQW09607.1 MAG: sigma-54-dependent Fis family transcriptional regulator [candidate division KSB1 bacterium]
MHNVLLVGGGASTLSQEAATIRALGHECRFVDVRTTVNEMLEFAPSVVMIEVEAERQDSFAVISSLHRINSSLPIIAFSHASEVSLIVKTVQLGAVEFYQLPSANAETVELMKRVLADLRAAPTVPVMQNGAYLPDFVGNSEESKKLAGRVMKIAPLDVNVMISGETGTGKELIAQNIHKLSNRANKPFIAIDCVSLPPNLIESEIFGHEQGAFTGATKTKKGLLELANGGTVFFDEITELDIYLQGKLLRILQERQFRRVGGSTLISVDIRIISATNRDPEEAVLQNKLRKDLYYRLNVVPLKLLPLRQRKGDISFLVTHFVEKLNESNKVQIKGITRRAMNALIKYEWPGNVRELQNVIMQAACLSESEMIDVDDLPDNLKPDEVATLQPAPKPESMNFKDARDQYLKQFCQIYFDGVLKKYRGNISKVAKNAEISRGTLYKLFKEFDIKNPYISS